MKKHKRDALLDAHFAEAERRGANIRNLGWGQSETGIASKTSKGILETEYVNGVFEHTWLRRE